MIIDSFPFNKDFNALEIRFEELKGVVDLFIASEASFTHSGLPKELHLTNATEFRRRMGDKLIVLATEKKPFTQNPRTREMMQRQEISKFIFRFGLAPEDLIIHSDCDEVPRASVIEKLGLQSTPVNALLELNNYANYLNARVGIWPRGRVQSFSMFQSVQHMRADIFIHSGASQRRHRMPIMRLTDFWSSKRFPFNQFPEYVKIPNLQVVSKGGWHFNNLLTESEIIEKIQSSCHVEWNTDSTRRKAIENYRQAADIYTGEKLKIVEIDSSFPRYIQEDIKRWEKFIYS